MLNYFEINKSNLLNNLSELTKDLGSDKLITAVVKANAYGHGLEQVVKSLSGHVDYFQVDDFLELEKLRTFDPTTPVAVLGYVEKEDLEKAINLNGTLGVASLSQLKAIIAVGKRLDREIQIHLCVDSLFGREGIMPAEVKDVIELLTNQSNIKLVGVYSHFADIDNVESNYYQEQLKVYQEACAELEKGGFTSLIKHTSATGGTIRYESTANEKQMVRIGIGLYGYWPSNGLKSRYQNKINLLPVLSWKSKIAQVKTISPGNSIGYSRTFFTEKTTRIAVIPQGYSDGYDRRLSNLGEVLIRGDYCPVLGRVSMNMLVVDVSQIDAHTEDDVVIIGAQGDKSITADDIAKKNGTIEYEILTNLNPLLPRIIT